ncbi:MAG: nuclear transport factor 2 family protein [Acidobacteriota bacterium]
MKEIIACIGMLLLAAFSSNGSSHGQTSGNRPRQMIKAEHEVLARHKAWCDAIVKGEMETLDQLLADDFIITSGNATLRDKKGELEDLKLADGLSWVFVNTDDLRVRVYGQAVVVTGRVRWRVRNRDREVDDERRFTSVFVKQKGQWRMVAQQMTRPPQQNRNQ